MEHFRGMEGPELIEVKDWSVWLRFSSKTSQSKVFGLLSEQLGAPMVDKWEIRPIWPVEEREKR